MTEDCIGGQDLTPQPEALPWQTVLWNSPVLPCPQVVPQLSRLAAGPLCEILQETAVSGSLRWLGSGCSIRPDGEAR